MFSDNTHQKKLISFFKMLAVSSHTPKSFFKSPALSSYILKNKINIAYSSLFIVINQKIKKVFKKVLAFYLYIFNKFNNFHVLVFFFLLCFKKSKTTFYAFVFYFFILLRIQKIFIIFGKLFIKTKVF